MVGTNNGGCVESVSGFNPARAVTDTFLSAGVAEAVYVGRGGWSVTPSAILPREGAGETTRVLEKVQGGDDRVCVTKTSDVPWRCIAQLVIRYANGLQGYGTGWFAGERTLITAGHCLVDPDTRTKAAEIQVIPGRSGEVAPYAFVKTRAFEVAPGWPDDPDADFGAIGLPPCDSRSTAAAGILTPQVPNGRQLGWFGLGVAKDHDLTRLLVNTAGYPIERDKPFGTMWFNAGRIHEAQPRHLTYLMDTMGGQSGAPVFYFDEATGERVVVAIHTTGDYPNRGIRITPKIFAQLKSWIEDPPREKMQRARQSARKGAS
jgi:V8-like Glu-specific endopeptidase